MKRYDIIPTGRNNMNVIKKLWARTFQISMRAVLPLLPYRKPKILKDVCEVPALLKDKGKVRALIVADPVIMQLGIAAPMLEAFTENNVSYSVYDKVIPNPTTRECEEARKLYIDEKCDCIVAIGGGSSLDCAKAVGARIARPSKPLAKMEGILKIRKKIPLLVAIPTTAGTGSETTLAAVICDAQTRHKYAIDDFPLIPSYAVLDKTLLKTLPAKVISTTGIDALTHAVEAYIGRSTTKDTRADSLNAIKLIFENLEEAYTTKSDISLDNMLHAAHYAGRAFSKSYVGYVHALAHALGGKYNTPHGLANAVLLAPVLKAYGSTIYQKLKKICVYCGFASEDDTPKQCAEIFFAKLEALENAVNIPLSLPEIKTEDLDTLVDYAYREAYPLYPVPVLWDREQLKKMYMEVSVNG